MLLHPGMRAASAPTRVASQFETTPLFVAIRTTADGTGTATFTAPQNLGTFVLRAYGVCARPRRGDAQLQR